MCPADIWSVCRALSSIHNALLSVHRALLGEPYPVYSI